LGLTVRRSTNGGGVFIAVSPRATPAEMMFRSVDFLGRDYLDGLNGASQARLHDKAFLVGTLSLVILYGTLYAVQFYRLSIAGQNPRITFGAIDKSAETLGGTFLRVSTCLGSS
jgi:hypothetical protein